MDIRSGIVSTARALGMSPLDLATIMSYETAGTFDPAKAGPTTQWGQHRGLIQFGQPQAQQYGVNWQDPIGSQLGPDGAVAKYFRAHGWQPGMGLMDAYSVVNAGAPGRYGASDSNNGGAPGTVADKVNNQFGPHRAKAQAFLGDALMGGAPAMQPNTQMAAAGQPGAGYMPTMPLLPDATPSGLASLFDPQPSGPMPQMQARAQQKADAEAEQRRKEALFGGTLFG